MNCASSWTSLSKIQLPQGPLLSNSNSDLAAAKTRRIDFLVCTADAISLHITNGAAAGAHYRFFRVLGGWRQERWRSTYERQRFQGLARSGTAIHLSSRQGMRNSTSSSAASTAATGCRCKHCPRRSCSLSLRCNATHDAGIQILLTDVGRRMCQTVVI
jgi:hypothetical protein